MSKKQKKMLIRIIAAGAIWAIGFAVEHIFPTDDRFSRWDSSSGDIHRRLSRDRLGYPVESYPEHRARSGV